MKPEIHADSQVDRKLEATMSESNIDFNRLYGDLCRKLLSTPVGEIFPGVGPDIPINNVTNATGSTSPSAIHPAFPPFATMATSQLGYLNNLYSPGGLLMAPMVLPQNSPEQKSSASHSPQQLDGAATPDGWDHVTESSLPVFGIENMGDVDIQKLVDEFKVTLERYGVSQRFAARFIMQDTSQGNLSFLMEKGRNKKWTELSPRGRLPYIKMKKWLESKDQQMATIDMLKYSQETKRNGSREAFNRRERFTMFQLKVLCRMFEENPNPPMNVRNSVADQLGVPLDRINVWFQNQRARGFPARKMLQQTLYSDVEPTSPTAEETVKENIYEAGHLSNSFQGSTKTSVVKSETYTNGGQPSSGALPTSTSVPNNATDLKSPVKSEPFDTSLPLDLSAASSFSADRSSESSSPVMWDLRPNSGVNNGLDYPSDLKPELFSPSPCQTNNAVKSVTSGAAKRKRGLKQQVTSAAKNETCDTKSTDLGPDASAKRRKLTEGQSNYTYLFDTSETPHEISHRCDNNSSEYEYIIKPENSADIYEYATKNDRGSNSRTQRKHVTPNGHIAIAETFPQVEKRTRDISSSMKGESTKSVAIFNAMCASLALSEENASDADMLEPDLD